MPRNQSAAPFYKCNLGICRAFIRSDCAHREKCDARIHGCTPPASGGCASSYMGVSVSSTPLLRREWTQRQITHTNNFAQKLKGKWRFLKKLFTLKRWNGEKVELTVMECPGYLWASMNPWVRLCQHFHYKLYFQRLYNWAIKFLLREVSWLTFSFFKFKSSTFKVIWV